MRLLTPSPSAIRMKGMTDPQKSPSVASPSAVPEPGSALALAVEEARERAIRVLSDGYGPVFLKSA